MIIEPVIDNYIQLKETKTPEKRFDFLEPSKNKERIFTSSKAKIKKEKSRVKINAYIASAIIFLLGILIGSIVFRLLINDISIQEMIVEKFIPSETISKEMIFEKSFERNIKLLIIYWIAGISVVGSPLLILLCLYKGFSTSFVISSFLLKYGFVQGNIYIFKNLFIYYIFLILGIIVLTASSLKVTKNVFVERKDIRYELIRHSIFTIIGFCLFFISTIIEVKML